MATTIVHDFDLDAGDVSQLNSADAVVAFFARLGYDVGGRVVQTAAALGITTSAVARKIRRIERIADHDQGGLQVYLAELDSVTVAVIHGLARALRDRAGNYLLVLTSGYDELDFVLLERQVTSMAGNMAALPRIGVRPRTLSVRRRNPGLVDLRVLRRLTYTEKDAEAQYAKLQSAYTVAEWSEPYFNNRGLFSDYFLNQRLPGLSEWHDDPKPAYQQLRQLYTGRAIGGTPEAEVQANLIVPALQILGFRVETAATQMGVDFLLQPQTGDGDRVACLAYGWDRYLDGKDDRRDTHRAAENPGARVVSALQSGVAGWAILTNGKVWRLYAGQAHSRATNYYEIDLEETLALPDPNEAFRYFWLLFRALAFRSVPVLIAGEQADLRFVDRLLVESGLYAHSLGDRLKDRIFDEVFKELATGFIQHVRASEGDGSDLSQVRLNEIFRATLTLLYRLLFLLYAESRDLLPAREVRGYWEVSVSKLKQEIEKAGGPIAEVAAKALAKHYSSDSGSTALYDRLLQLAGIIDRGDAAVNVPTYNGGLFAAADRDEPTQLDEKAARFLLDHKIADRFLARALDLLARDVDDRTHALVPIDYKSLGVRQLGSIYEGLLEFRLRIADQKMAVVKGKRTDEIVPYAQAVKEGMTILTAGRARAAAERTLPKGAVYLANERRERRASGSYYTPDHIVTHIVDQAVGPVLAAHLERLRPVFRDSQRAAVSRNSAPAQTPDEVVDLLFDFRILDPAMGSGHFLIEAVDFATDKILDFLNAFPNNPVQARLQSTRETILSEMDRQGVSIDPTKLTEVNLLKRHVLKRSVFGVDLNPMAVELAKVSVWLDCFTLGAPLSFLDHHLRCGNSLIGADVAEVRAALEPATSEDGSQQLAMFASKFAGLRLATDLMHHVGELSDVTTNQVAESKAEYRKAIEALAPFKRILDLYTAQWFVTGEAVTQARRGRRTGISERHLLAFLKSPESETLLRASNDREFRSALESLTAHDRGLVEGGTAATSENRFLHWELEFPEAYYQRLRGSVQPRESAGFDAVIGNPPYDVQSSQELGRDVSKEIDFYKAQAGLFQPAIRGKNNLYKLFICRGHSLARERGALSFIVPMALLGDDQSRGVRELLLDAGGLVSVEVFPQKDDPKRRVFPEAKLSTAVFVGRMHTGDDPFVVRTHPGRFIEESSEVLTIRPSEPKLVDTENVAIFSCTQADWDLAVRLVSSKGVQRMSQVATQYQGEVNETVERPRGALSTDPKDPLALRGANISLYAVRKASQGEDIHIDTATYLARDRRSEGKTLAYREERVGFQRSAPQNNFRRLIAARIQPGFFCLDTVSYVLASESKIPSEVLLALLNSRLLDWYFRLGSTNSKVNEYQFHNLPVPAIVPGLPDPELERLVTGEDWAAAQKRAESLIGVPGTLPMAIVSVIAGLVRRIEEIEGGRSMARRSERANLAPNSQTIQDVVDNLLCRAYGLSTDDGQYITRRLGEML